MKNPSPQVRNTLPEAGGSKFMPLMGFFVTADKRSLALFLMQPDLHCRSLYEHLGLSELADDERLGQAFEARELDVLGAEHLEHRRTREPHVGGGEVPAEREGREHRRRIACRREQPERHEEQAERAPVDALGDLHQMRVTAAMRKLHHAQAVAARVSDGSTQTQTTATNSATYLVNNRLRNFIPGPGDTGGTSSTGEAAGARLRARSAPPEPPSPNPASLCERGDDGADAGGDDHALLRVGLVVLLDVFEIVKVIYHQSM